MNKTQLNISNLHSLWKAVGMAFGGYAQHGKVYQSRIPDSEWPNKIWTTFGGTDVAIGQIRSQMVIDPALVFSHFVPENDKGDAVEKQGFDHRSTQYGMSMELKNPFKVSGTLTFKKVESTKDAVLWSSAFKQAFSYKISADTLELTQQNIPYFLAFDNDKLVGTIILYITGNVAGIHSLGIVPEMRKKGYAAEIMRQVLNRAMEHKAQVATLQASEMAKKMYLGMGFSTDFLMHNYAIDPKL